MCEDSGCNCIGSVVDDSFQSAFDYENLIRSAIVFYGRNFSFDDTESLIDGVVSALEEIMESDLDADLIYDGTITTSDTGFVVEVQMVEDANVGFKIEAVFADDAPIVINSLPFEPTVDEESDIDDLPFDLDTAGDIGDETKEEVDD